MSAATRRPARVVRVVVESFGYLHGRAPRADLVIDLRELRNPLDDPRMRELTGLHSAVRDHVLATPGARRILTATLRDVEKLLPKFDRRGRLVRVAFGCGGGRHRSVAMAEELGDELAARGIGVEVSHRDKHRPVVRKR